MKRLRISDEARADLASIRAYTSREWGAAQARSYLAAIKQRLGRLRRQPSLGVACDEVEPGLRRLMAGRHFAFYVEREDAVMVVRILHQRMDYRARLGGLPEEPS